MDNQNNKHNLENTGNVMGQVFNTGKYNEKYSEKKGMKFFVIMIVLVILASLIILNLRKFPAVTIVFAGNEGITVHYIKTNTFGKSRLTDEEFIEFDYDGYSFDNLEGKAAQVAYVIKNSTAEFVVADADILYELAGLRYLTDITFFIDGAPEEDILIYDQVWSGNAVMLHYGIRIKNRRYYDAMPDNGYAAVVNPVIATREFAEKTFIIHDFTRILASGEPYRAGTRTYATTYEID